VLADAVRSRLARYPAQRLGSITLAELSATPQPIGLYFLFDDQQCLQYVGKSSSRSFIERIPSHLDPRPDGWFNTLPKKLIARSPLIDYRSALEHALGLIWSCLASHSSPSSSTWKRHCEATSSPH
jgi:hypothetical protein